MNHIPDLTVNEKRKRNPSLRGLIPHLWADAQGYCTSNSNWCLFLFLLFFCIITSSKNIVRPVTVSISGADKPLSAGKAHMLECIAGGSVPAASIHWYLHSVQQLAKERVNIVLIFYSPHSIYLFTSSLEYSRLASALIIKSIMFQLLPFFSSSLLFPLPLSCHIFLGWVDERDPPHCWVRNIFRYSGFKSL